MRGMTVVRALACAAKIKQGGFCSKTELAAALDTLAWAYKNRSKFVDATEAHEKSSKKRFRKQGKRVYRSTKRSF